MTEHVVYEKTASGKMEVVDRYIDLTEDSPDESTIQCDPQTLTVSPQSPMEDVGTALEPNVHDRFQLPPAASLGVPVPDRTEYVVQFQDHGILPGRMSLKRKRATAIEMCVCNYCLYDMPLGNKARTVWLAQNVK